MAEAARDTYLAEFAWPRVSRSIATGSVMSVSVSCLGYYYLLDKFIYVDNTNPAAAVNASTKIASILAAEPNGFFPNTPRISTNTLQVPAVTDDRRTGLAAIKDIVALGDANGARWLFGVYEDITPVYEVVNDAAEYIFDAGSVDGHMRSYTGGHIIPSALVRPGNWVLITGLLLESLDTTMTSNRLNQGYEFIESVSYNAPHDLTTQSGTVNTFAQMIAQQGLRSRQ